MVIIYGSRRKIKFLPKHLQLAFSWTNSYLSKFQFCIMTCIYNYCKHLNLHKSTDSILGMCEYYLHVLVLVGADEADLVAMAPRLKLSSPAL